MPPEKTGAFFVTYKRSIKLEENDDCAIIDKRAGKHQFDFLKTAIQPHLLHFQIKILNQIFIFIGVIVAGIFNSEFLHFDGDRME